MHRNTCTSGLFQTQQQIDKKHALIKGYGSWLNSYEWDYYCTFTTRYQLTLPSARRTMVKLHGLLTHNLGAAPIFFWVAEPFDTKYGCHLHALLALNNKTPTSKTDIKNAWQVVSKGKGLKEYNNTTIKEYDRFKGGHFYLTKYLQRNDVDYDIL